MSKVVQFTGARAARMPDSKPALEGGFIRIVNAVAEGLAKFPLSQLESRCVWAIIRKTYGFNKSKDRIAASQLAELMSSPEQTITRQKASTVLAGLIRKRVVIREGGGQSAIKINTVHSEWQRPVKATKAPQNPKLNRNKEKGNKNGSLNRNTVHFPNPNTVHTKDTLKDILSNPSDYLWVPVQKPGSSNAGNAGNQSSKPGKPNKKPKHLKKPVPFNAIVDLYHEILPGNPEFIDWTSTREGQVRARWNQKIGRSKQPCNSLEFWRRFFEYVAQSDFLCGRKDPKPGHKRFVADLEWLTKAGNFMRIIERKYHDTEEEQQQGVSHETGGRNNRSGESELDRQLTDLEYARNNF